MTLLPTLAGDVTVNGLTLNFVDEDGSSWWMSNLDGWWGLPEVDVPDEDRPAPFDGGYSLEGRYKPRLMTLSGGFRPSGAGQAPTARAKLSKALQLVHSEGLLVVQESEPKQAVVRLSGKPVISVVDATGTTVFEVGLKSADPRKFSTVLTDVSLALPITSSGVGLTPPLTPPLSLPQSISSGTVTVSNDGNYPTDMVITFTERMESPSLLNNTTGEFMLFDTVIADGQSLVVDTANRSALVDGQDNRNFTITSASTWFTLPPGDTDLEFHAESASPLATARVQFRSAWID